jgi:hypothetical protein
VFFDALRYLSDVVGWEDWEADGWETGIAVFDRLTQGQKQVALLQVARALLQASAQPPKVTAYLAATVAAVYETVLDLIQLDIETDNRRTELRSGVLAALDEMDYWTSVNEARLPEEGQSTVRPPAVPTSTYGRTWWRACERKCSRIMTSTWRCRSWTLTPRPEPR